MIVDTKRDDVFEGPYSHIAFAVNTQGVNDAGFAGQVSRRYWPGLATIGPGKLGKAVSHKADGGRVFHALVCHSLGGEGWDRSPEAIQESLDVLDLPEHTAIVLAGSGPVGQMQGADVYAILGGMARSRHKLIVYTR